MNIIVTGTSRGIGLELVKEGLRRGHRILAVARNLGHAAELQDLKNSHPSIEFLDLDLNLPDADQKIATAVRNWDCVDVVINNAGIYLDDDTVEDFEKSFLINSIKPLFVTRALRSSLKKSSRPLSVQITSQMGSVEDNTSGGSYSYRASKVALNMLFKSFSVDEPWLISLLVHPGWVKTRMGGSAAPVSTYDSAAGIWKLIDEASLSQSGSFVTFKGKKLPW